MSKRCDEVKKFYSDILVNVVFKKYFRSILL